MMAASTPGQGRRRSLVVVPRRRRKGTVWCVQSMGSLWGRAWTILIFYNLRYIEREAHLLITAALIALHWPLSIRLLCLHCVADDLQGDSEDDEPCFPGGPAEPGDAQTLPCLRP